MAGHAKSELYCLDPLSGDARPVRGRLQPRPLCRFGQRIDVFLDAGGSAEEEHLRRVRFDPKGVRCPTWCEGNHADPAPLRAGGHPGWRFASILSLSQFDDPCGDFPVQHVESLVLGMGVQRRCRPARKHAFPEREAAIRLSTVELQSLKRAEKPDRLLSAQHHLPDCLRRGQPASVPVSTEPIPIQVNPWSPATIWRLTLGGQ